MNKRLIGALGEQVAAREYRKKGYDIYTGNFVTPVGEIDLVVAKDSLICFVEVKTRRRGTMLPPKEAVTKKKIENIKSAAAIYLNEYEPGFKEVRYDIFEVYIDENDKYLDYNLIPGAFS